MWFMVYQMKDKRTMDWGSVCNCTINQHPVLTLKRWTSNESGNTYDYRLLFYDELPDDVAKEVREIDM